MRNESKRSARRQPMPAAPTADRLERTAGRAETRFQRLFESNIAGILLADLDGTIQAANDAFLEMLGYTRHDLPLRWDELTPPEWRPLDEAAIEVVRSKGSTPPWEKEFFARGGKRVPVLVMGAALVEGDESEVIGIVVDLSERRRAEQEIFRQRRELRDLTISLAHAQEAERRRIAAGLHDDIGQTLAAAKLQLGRLAKSGPPPRVVEQLAEVCEQLDHAIQASRALTFDLSAPVLYELGLEAALQSLGERLQHETGIQFELDWHGGIGPLSDDMGVFCYRAVCELLHNVTKHARAQRAIVSLRCTGDELRVRVEDDGVGFDSAEAGKNGSAAGGFGLFSIAQQLDHIGGSLTVESRPGDGTGVVAVIPLGFTEGSAT